MLNDNMVITTPVSDAMQRVWEEFADLEGRIGLIENRLSQLNSNKQAHFQVKQQDTRTIINRGDLFDLVVIESPAELDGRKALTKIEGVYTFIDPADLDLTRGCVVRATIVDAGDKYAEALALEAEIPEVSE